MGFSIGLTIGCILVAFIAFEPLNVRFGNKKAALLCIGGCLIGCVIIWATFFKHYERERNLVEPLDAVEIERIGNAANNAEDENEEGLIEDLESFSQEEEHTINDEITSATSNRTGDEQPDAQNSAVAIAQNNARNPVIHGEDHTVNEDTDLDNAVARSSTVNNPDAFQSGNKTKSNVHATPGAGKPKIGLTAISLTPKTFIDKTNYYLKAEGVSSRFTLLDDDATTKGADIEDILNPNQSNFIAASATRRIFVSGEYNPASKIIDTLYFTAFLNPKADPLPLNKQNHRAFQELSAAVCTAVGLSDCTPVYTLLLECYTDAAKPLAANAENADKDKTHEAKNTKTLAADKPVVKKTGSKQTKSPHSDKTKSETNNPASKIGNALDSTLDTIANTIDSSLDPADVSKKTAVKPMQRIVLNKTPVYIGFTKYPDNFAVNIGAKAKNSPFVCPTCVSDKKAAEPSANNKKMLNKEKKPHKDIK